MSEPLSHCYRCEKDRPAAELVTRSSARYFGLCRACVAAIGAARKAAPARATHTETERVCYHCRRSLPADAFTRRANGTFFSACKDCNRIFGQQRRARLKRDGGRA